MNLDGYIYTNKGCREYNEDAAALEEKDGNGIYIVADGLGGHINGQIASRCVTDALIESWNTHSKTEEQFLLNKQILSANQKLLELQKEMYCTMKSTIVALEINGSSAVWAHVGDSRLYYLHRNSICDITQDHSVAYKKYKAGEITKAQIAQDEDQSCLLQALGNGQCEPDVHTQVSLESGDAFLLCSDGAWEYLYDEEILIDFLKAETANKWAKLLLLRIFERQKPECDNLTILTVIVN